MSSLSFVFKEWKADFFIIKINCGIVHLQPPSSFLQQTHTLIVLRSLADDYTVDFVLYTLHTVFLRVALQRTNTENWKQIFPEMKLRGHSPNFPTHVSVSDLYILPIDLPILLQETCGPILRIYKSLTDTWKWKLAAQFPEKEYINGIFVAVCILLGTMHATD